MSSPSSTHPTAIGPYQVLEVLGKGSAGDVYRCTAPDGRTVAVKLARLYDSDDVLRFNRECRLQLELGGDGLLPLLDVGSCDLGPYAVLPLIDGGTLHDRLRLGPLPWPHAVRLVRRLAEVAGRMHAAGVVHRDLKPANVLLTSTGEAWVADLGLSKHSDRTRDARSVSFSKSGVFSGTPGFMAPEQAYDAKSAGPAADVFSLGAILYTALAGREPFAGSNAAECVEQSATGSYAPLRAVVPDLPAWVSGAVVRALAPTPESRPPTGAAFASLLQAPKSGTPEPALLPRWFFAVLAVGLLGLALGGWALVSSKTGRAPVEPTAGLESPSPAPPPPVDPEPATVESPNGQSPEADPVAEVDPVADPVAGEDFPLPLPQPGRADGKPAVLFPGWEVSDPEVVLSAPGGHLGMIREVEVHPHQPRILTGGMSGELCLWDATNGELKVAWHVPDWGRVDGVGFGAEGVLYGVTESGLLLHGTPEEGLKGRPSGHPSCWELAPRPDGGWLTCGPDGLRCWSAEEAAGEGPPPELACPGPIYKARSHPVAGGLALGKAAVWRWTTPGVMEQVSGGPPPRPYEDLRWSPDGSCVATLTHDDLLTLYSWPELKLLAERRVFERPPGTPGYMNTRGLCFSAAGDRIFTAGADPEIRAWTVPALEPSAGGWHPRWPPWTECVRVGLNGSMIAGGNSGQLMAFDAEGKALWPYSASPFAWPAQTPQGGVHFIHTEHGMAWLDEAGTSLVLNCARGVEVLEVATGRRFVQASETPRFAGQRMVTGGRRMFGLLHGELSYATLRCEGERLYLDGGQTLGRQPSREFHDLAYVGGLLYVAGSLGANQEVTLWAIDLEDDGRRNGVSPPLRVGGSRPLLGDSAPEGAALSVFGTQRALLLREDQGQLLWKPGEEVRAIEYPRPVFHVAWCADDRAVFVDVDGGCSIVDFARGAELTIAMPGVRTVRVWNEGLVASYGDQLAVMRLDTGEQLQSFAVTGDAVVCLTVSPNADAFYAWTLRGQILRYPIRRQ